MKFRILKRSRMILHPAAFGDCSRCGHSIMYHLPFIGCTDMSCNCREYK